MHARARRSAIASPITGVFAFLLGRTPAERNKGPERRNQTGKQQYADPQRKSKEWQRQS
jgi:hypothetical protein